MNKMNSLLSSLITCLCTSTIRLCFAGDVDNLFDVCPTDMNPRSNIFINGYPCKNPSDVTPSDFKSSLLNEPGDTDNVFSSCMTLATAADFPGLNTLGLSTARIDLEIDGVVTPHAHPRASEMIFVRTGSVVAGFVDSGNRIFQKRLREGDVFIFPKGLLHFCLNPGFEDATIFSVLNGQNPGLVSISSGLFVGNGSNANDRIMMMVEKLKRTSMRDLDGVSVVELFGE